MSSITPLMKILILKIQSLRGTKQSNKPTLWIASFLAMTQKKINHLLLNDFFYQIIATFAFGFVLGVYAVSVYLTGTWI